MKARGRSGFTLVELLISMLILAFGIMAVLSMQFTALGGMMLSRDNSNASDVARRLMQVMRVESQQWRQGSLSGSITTASYPTSQSAFAADPLLGSVADANGAWERLFAKPLDARLSTLGATRYCAYARGDQLATDLYWVQVAVVFPSANEVFKDRTCPSYDNSNLDPELAPDNANSLQMQGMRVQYFGTQLSQRGHLPPL